MKRNIILLSVLLILSCGEDEATNIAVPTYPPANAETSSISIGGEVIDENGNSIVDVKVTLSAEGSSITERTDDDGRFQFNDVNIKGDHAYLRYRKSEFFEGFQSLPVMPDSYNFTKSKLAPQIVTSQFDASIDGEILLSNGTKIVIPENTLVNDAGSPYEGEVRTYLKYVDPSSNDFEQEMIGGLVGIGLENDIVGLQSFGMVQVELVGDDGRELNLNGTRKAEVEFPIPNGFTQLPEEIPVWSFDEEQGVWIEEEMARLVGGKYITAVSHFSAWNLDLIITDPVSLGGKVYLNDMLAANKLLRFKFEDGQSVGGILNDKGEFELSRFPAGMGFTACIINTCGDIEDRVTFSGISANDNIEINFESDVTISSTVELSGSVFNCDGEPLVNGKVFYENILYLVDESGGFKISHCLNTERDLIIIDEENCVSKIISIAENSSFDNIQVCADPDAQFILSTLWGCVQNSPVKSYTCDEQGNHTIIFDLIEDNIEDPITHTFEFQIPESYTLPMEFVVDFPIKSLRFYCYRDDVMQADIYSSYDLSGGPFFDPKIVVITEYIPDEYIKGMIDWNSPITEVPSMSFKLSKTE